MDFYNQSRTTRGGERKRKSIQHSFFIQSTVPPSSPTRSFSPIKVNLLGHSCQGNPGLPWRRLGSRCRATYTTNRCILGEQLRAGEDTASAALPLAEPLPSSKPFLLFHSPTCRPTKPPLTHHTRSACLSGCPHASLPSAAGALVVTPHHFACTVASPLRVCAWVRRSHSTNDMVVHACAKVRPRMVRQSLMCCVSVCLCTFLGQCVLIRDD